MNRPAPSAFRLRPAHSVFVLPLFVFLSAFLVASFAAPVAPLTHDAGEGLTYYRIRTLPADLPTDKTSGPHSTILDLRYVSGDTAAAPALHAWLKFHAATRAPVFLLVNSATAPALLAPFADHRPAGLLLLGPASTALTPDLVIKTTPADERRAYDALAAGTPFATLLLDAPHKPRNDEASLARDRTVDSSASSEDEFDADLPVPAAKPQTPPPLIDAALQRAVHVHRALKALKKL